MNNLFIKKLKEKSKEIQVKTSDVISTLKIDEETRNTRLDLCLSCEYLFKPTQNCKKCGCFVQAKTWLTNSSCPVKKW